MDQEGPSPDVQALRTRHSVPLLDCGAVPQSDSRLLWRRERFGDPQRVVSISVREKGRLAIVRGRSDPPDWSLPGGGVEPGESFEQAAVRETKEECGLDVTLLHPLAIVTARLVASVGSMHWLDVLFAARPIGDVLRPLDIAEVEETRWAEIDELDGLYASGRMALSWLSFGRSAMYPVVDSELLAILRRFAAGAGATGTRSSGERSD